MSANVADERCRRTQRRGQATANNGGGRHDSQRKAGSAAGTSGCCGGTGKAAARKRAPPSENRQNAVAARTSPVWQSAANRPPTLREVFRNQTRGQGATGGEPSPACPPDAGPSPPSPSPVSCDRRSVCETPPPSPSPVSCDRRSVYGTPSSPPSSYASCDRTGSDCDGPLAQPSPSSSNRSGRGGGTCDGSQPSWPSNATGSRRGTYGEAPPCPPDAAGSRRGTRDGSACPPDAAGSRRGTSQGSPCPSNAGGFQRGTYDVPPSGAPMRGTYDVPPAGAPMRGTYDVPPAGSPASGTFTLTGTIFINFPGSPREQQQRTSSEAARSLAGHIDAMDDGVVAPRSAAVPGCPYVPIDEGAADASQQRWSDMRDDDCGSDSVQLDDISAICDPSEERVAEGDCSDSLDDSANYRSVRSTSSRRGSLNCGDRCAH